MKNNVLSMTRILPGIVLAGSTFTVCAGGVRTPDQDAFATARGEAFVATADNPSAIYYNPAGITQLDGANLRAGLYGIYLDPSYQPPSGGQTFDNEAKLHALPQLFCTYKPQDSRFAFGLGIFAPYGLGLRWPQDTGFRTVGTESSLTYLTINPVVAMEVLPHLSVAAGLTVNYSQIELEQGLFWPSQELDNFTFKGEGWQVGYNLGVRWQPIEKIALGASLRSQTTMDFGGHTEYVNTTPVPLPGGGAIPAFPSQRVAASANFNFPLIAIVGISYRPTEKWNFEFDADYADWNTVKTVTIKQANGFPPLLPQDVPVVLNWQSSWYYELGATRYLANGWHVSAGYIFNESSVPAAHYTPLVADVDKHFFSVGVGQRGKRWDWDVAYQFGYGPSTTISGSTPSATGQTADGRYEFISHAVAVSVGYHF